VPTPRVLSLAELMAAKFAVAEETNLGHLEDKK
jgi:hypothetical protein